MEQVKSVNLDVNESAYFSRQLENVKSRTYDIKYPMLKATNLIPVSTEAGSGAETITYEQFNSVGLMKIVSNYADNLPRADVFGKEFTSTIKSLGGSYGYNVQEIRNGQMAGKPLNPRKAEAVRKANEQAVNRIAWFGDSDAGLLGLLTNPNIPSAIVPAGTTSGNVPWVGATPKNPDEILRDMNDAVTRIVDLTKGAEMPNTMIMPIEQYRKISTTRLTNGNDNTILKFFLENNPGFTVDWVNELKDVDPAPSGGPAPTDVMITYDRNPNVLTLEIPQPFEQFPAQERNLEFVVPAHSRIGGVIVYYPLAIDIAEGI